MPDLYLNSARRGAPSRPAGPGHRTGIALLAAAMGLVAASPAAATNYYNASGAAIITINNVDTAFHQETTNPLVPQAVNLTGGRGWSIIATANDNDGGTVTADVGVPPNFNYDSPEYLKQISASASLSYDFSLAGGAIGSIVQVLVSGAGHATQSDANLGGYASASVQLSGLGGDLLRYGIDTVGSQGATTGGSFSVNDIVSMVVGNPYRLALGAYAKGATDPTQDAHTQLPDGKYALFSAGVDPRFTILGSDAAAYHFVGLPDSAIGGVAAAVPEPASWAMMVGGFGLIGSAMRYRRRMRPSVAPATC